VKLCNGGECDVEAESDSDDEDHIRYHKNLKKNLDIRFQFVFSIPASNAFCEIIFIHMKYLWNNNRNRMMHDLVSAELKIQVNIEYNCSEFYDHLLNNQDLLKQIRSSQKSTHVAKIPRTR
ncbi:unnamed protein product, partial [Rotaria sp. Silwood2]